MTSISPGPVHPHPLSNDLTTEALPPHTADEYRRAGDGIDPGTKRLVRVIGVIIGAFAVLGLIGAAVAMSDDREIFLFGAFLFTIYLVFIGAPLILATGTKLAQDEAVRDGATSIEPRVWVHPGQPDAGEMRPTPRA